jgi:hypothetical protein
MFQARERHPIACQAECSMRKCQRSVRTLARPDLRVPDMNKEEREEPANSRFEFVFLPAFLFDVPRLFAYEREALPRKR